MSLRLRVVLVIGLTTTVVLLLAGGALVALFAEEERSDLDERLRQQSGVAAEAASRAVDRPGQRQQIPSERFAPNLNLVARALEGDEQVLVVGDHPLAGAGAVEPGFSTVTVDEEQWRVLSRSIGDDLTVEVAVPSSEVEDRIADMRRQVTRLGIAAAVLAAVAGWFLAGRALRPLSRLRNDAERVTGSRSGDDRVRDDQGLREVDDLGAALNDMLDRLGRAASETEAALEASRGFAANAAHELRTPLTSIRANVDVLAANPDLSAGERSAVLDEIQQQEARLLRLLDELRLLARGDLASMPDEEVSLVDLVGEAVDTTRRRHPKAEFELTTSQDDLIIRGWREGLRVLVDNLLDNAAIHGRRGGVGPHVEVRLHADGGAAVLAVDDDGRGIAPEDRDRVLERFGRGAEARAGGSGLGLALVAQQADLHGGSVSITEGPRGGARIVVRLVGRDHPV